MAAATSSIDHFPDSSRARPSATSASVTPRASDKRLEKRSERWASDAAGSRNFVHLLEQSEPAYTRKRGNWSKATSTAMSDDSRLSKKKMSPANLR